jgi:hypothetical protein
MSGSVDPRELAKPTSRADGVSRRVVNVPSLIGAEAAA